MLLASSPAVIRSGPSGWVIVATSRSGDQPNSRPGGCWSMPRRKNQRPHRATSATPPGDWPPLVSAPVEYRVGTVPAPVTFPHSCTLRYVRPPFLHSCTLQIYIFFLSCGLDTQVLGCKKYRVMGRRVEQCNNSFDLVPVPTSRFRRVLVALLRSKTLDTMSFAASTGTVRLIRERLQKRTPTFPAQTQT
jgi:hypothetical protein